MAQNKLCAGRIGRPYGVMGALHVQSFLTSDSSFLRQSCFFLNLGGKLEVQRICRSASAGFIVQFLGIEDRSEAERLAGEELYIPRPALGEGEYFSDDIVQLVVRNEAGAKLGHVVAVHDFGAGAFLELVLTDGRIGTLIFDKTAIRGLNLDEGWITVAADQMLI